jgi:hypothetical protein
MTRDTAVYRVALVWDRVGTTGPETRHQLIGMLQFGGYLRLYHHHIRVGTN